mgnify:CR=1 FL=1
MLTLGIETSCDETGCAVLSSHKVLSSVVSSSVHLHKPYGGVVPEIASRYHIEYINSVVRSALKKAGKTFRNLNLIAVTYGPGLCGSLLTGISFAKSLSYALRKPLIGVNHISAHLYANFINKKKSDLPKFPFVGLVISGGHTTIFLCNDICDFRVLGQTQDDAIGEAFDKVAKILTLGYPGGPIIEKKAKSFKRGQKIDFPRAYMGKDSMDFSFSGVKTAVLYFAKNKKLTKKLVSAISYSFQESVFDVVCKNTVMASKKHKVDTIVIGGGVAANKKFCEKMKRASSAHNIKLFIPKIRFCLDNGAMVAALGEKMYRKGMRSDLTLTAEPNLERMVC